jgi:uncharacterized protein YjiS (DUF1127 family)
MLMFVIRESCGSTRRPIALALFDRLLGMLAVSRQRRQLAQLSDAQLKDIGITRADAEREASQPFWRIS